MRSYKRACPRIKVKLWADIAIQSEHFFSAQTVNLSNGGLAIQCSTAERNRITPQGDFIRQGRPINVSLELPLPFLDHAFQVDAAIVYSRRLSQNKCQLGLRFIGLSVAMQECLAMVVNRAENKSDVIS